MSLLAQDSAPERTLTARPTRAALGPERLASWLSAVCAIHCLVLPAASALLPLMGASAAVLGGELEHWLSALVIMGAVSSLALGYRRHRDLRIAGALVVSLLVYVLGHSAEPAWYGAALSIAGGLGLAAASFWSVRHGHVHAPGECRH